MNLSNLYVSWLFFQLTHSRSLQAPQLLRLHNTLYTVHVCLDKYLQIKHYFFYMFLQQACNYTKWW